mgnify:FL=1
MACYWLELIVRYLRILLEWREISVLHISSLYVKSTLTLTLSKPFKCYDSAEFNESLSALLQAPCL